MEDENIRKIEATLTFFVKGNQILLGEKKRGFAKGTYNGIGGKQDEGETIEQAMVRECQEEIGATPTNYEKVGQIDFDSWYKGERSKMKMHIYKCYDFVGTIKETEEIIPQWFDANDIPFDKMLEDDLLWLPSVLEGKNVVGEVKFDKNLKMLSHEIKTYDETLEKIM